MTSSEARELFSEALAGELDRVTFEQFQIALQADANLSEEYREFAAFCAALRNSAASQSAAPVPDLLPGVQRRIRARSRGRFYRDRFAERSGLKWHPTVALALALLTLLALAWLGVVLFEAVSPR